MCNFSEIPVTFTLTLVDLNTLEHEDACFKCELSKADVKINWYKNDKKIKSDNIKYKSKQKGKKRTLTIYDVDENDMGEYSIRLNGHDSSSAMLVVKGKASSVNMMKIKNMFIIFFMFHDQFYGIDICNHLDRKY